MRISYILDSLIASFHDNTPSTTHIAFIVLSKEYYDTLQKEMGYPKDNEHLKEHRGIPIVVVPIHSTLLILPDAEICSLYPEFMLKPKITVKL